MQIGQTGRQFLAMKMLLFQIGFCNRKSSLPKVAHLIQQLTRHFKVLKFPSEIT